MKYVSPEFAGFSASASWGQDDFWDIALRYTGAFAGLKVASGIGYFEQSDDTANTNTVGAFANGTKQSFTQFGGSLSVLHEATGLFLNVGAGEKNDRLARQTALGQAGADDGQWFWSLQGGIEKKYFPVGKSTIYGEYYHYEGGGNNRRTIAAGDALNTVGGAANLWSSDVEVFGAGFAQGFDSAALTLYISYRHVEGDITLRNIATGARAASPTRRSRSRADRRGDQVLIFDPLALLPRRHETTPLPTGAAFFVYEVTAGDMAKGRHLRASVRRGLALL